MADGSLPLRIPYVLAPEAAPEADVVLFAGGGGSSETELAAAMGVPKRYVLGHDAAGRRVTKTKITKMVGNMVSPPPAAALLRALFPEVQGRAA